jgi:predicted PurR-regulated permease PerM
MLVALIVGVMTSVGFLIIGLEFWLIIGMIAGALNIIPFVGPWVGGFLGVTVGFVTADLQTAVLAAVVALIVQQIDNHLISPNVLRATVHLHPAVIILLILLGGALGGIWGVLLVVPIAAIIKIVVGHLWRTRVLGQSWEDAFDAILESSQPPDTLLGEIRETLHHDEEPAGADAGGDVDPAE